MTNPILCGTMYIEIEREIVMKVRIMKNTWTSVPAYFAGKRKRGWIVVDENIEPIMMTNCPFKTKKNAINAVKNGRFESWGVTGITRKPPPSWYYESY